MGKKKAKEWEAFILWGLRATIDSLERHTDCQQQNGAWLFLNNIIDTPPNFSGVWLIWSMDNIRSGCVLSLSFFFTVLWLDIQLAGSLIQEIANVTLCAVHLYRSCKLRWPGVGRDRPSSISPTIPARPARPQSIHLGGGISRVYTQSSILYTRHFSFDILPFVVLYVYSLSRVFRLGGYR